MGRIDGPGPGGAETDGATAERRRMVDALLRLCRERGFPDVTLPMLLERADVNRAAFEREFADLEDCFLQIYVGFRDDLMGSIARTVQGEPTWRERIRAVAYTMVEYMEVDELRTHFIVTEVR